MSETVVMFARVRNVLGDSGQNVCCSTGPTASLARSEQQREEGLD